MQRRAQTTTGATMEANGSTVPLSRMSITLGVRVEMIIRAASTVAAIHGATLNRIITGAIVELREKTSKW